MKKGRANATNDTAMKKRENNSTVNIPERLEQTTYYTPLVDITENNDGFVFQADLPGVKPGNVDISYDNGGLTLDAKVQPRQAGEQRCVWREYGVGHFHRQFSIGAAVDVDGIKGELKNGELTLHVPKQESAKAKKIEIRTA